MTLPPWLMILTLVSKVLKWDGSKYIKAKVIEEKTREGECNWDYRHLA